MPPLTLYQLCNPIASGYVGEKITWSTSPATQALTTAATDWTNASFQLTPGVWEIKGAIAFGATTGNVAGNQVAVLAQLTDAANNLAQGQSKSLVFTTGANFACYFEALIPIFCTVNITTNTTYKLRVYLFNANGSNSGFVLNAGNSRSELYAIRIA